jgi:hypothetical protein
MGTTLDVVAFAGDRAIVAHVGDSRTYLFRDARIHLLTTDHTMAERLVREGRLSRADAQRSQLRQYLTNAIGSPGQLFVETARIPIRVGDKLLMCSDGLYDYFPDAAELAAALAGPDDARAIDQLIDLANERGGADNITAVVISIHGLSSATASAGGQATSARAPDAGPPVDESRPGGHRRRRPTGELPVLLFGAGARTLAVPLRSVERVTPTSEELEVRHIAELIGVAAPEDTGEQRLVRVSDNGYAVEFIVDAPVRSRTLPSDQLLPLADGDDAADAPLIGVAHAGDSLVWLLDVPRLIASA